MEHHQVVAKASDRWFDQLEVDRRHLGAEQGVILFHVFGKDDPVIGAGYDGSGIMALLSDPQGGNQRTDPDPGGSQVVDFVDL